MPPGIVIRDLATAAWPRVAEIYRAGIASQLAAVETGVPEWTAWNAGHLARPRLVAESDAGVLGWAALAPVSARFADRGVAEVSVYVAPDAQGRGIGRALLGALLAAADAAGFGTLQASIFARNERSIHLHQHAGFRMVGRRERIGELEGRWLDTLILERRVPGPG